MPPKILIVDDDKTIRSALTRWLIQFRYTVIEASTACEALQIVDSDVVDLALVDVRLPDMDGLDLSRQIIALNKDIPVLLITAFPDLDTARQALNIGVYEYFAKPFDFTELEVGITRALQHRKLAQENRAYRHKLEQDVAERTQELQETNERLHREIEERKKIEQQLVQFERLGALSEMAEGVSHNLNNILTGILGPAQLIELYTQDQNILNETKVIQDAAARATDLVKRLSISVRGETGQPMAVDVAQAIQKAIDITQPKWKDEAQAKGIQITIEPHLENTPPIYATEIGLHNVLLNLLLNAIDALKNDGTITITTKQRSDTVQIDISDTGQGMVDEVKRRVFEPFFTTRAEVGRGLGMSVVYSSINRWGGRILLDSTPNKGTTISIYLPIWQETHTASQKPASRAAKILIVDDEELVRTFLSRTLSPHYQVDAVTDGVEGIEKFKQNPYDVVLVDLGMPNLPGNKVIEHMKEIAPNISTILITGWQLSAQDPRFQAFDYHLLKPFESVQTILTTVAQAIQTYDDRQTNSP